MSLKRIFCIWEAENDMFPTEQSSSVLSASTATGRQGKGPEKEHVLEEDEMERRLTDIRREISNAKVDW